MIKDSIRIASLNCKTKLVSDDFLLNLVTFLNENQIDILCVQETGFLTPIVDVSQRLLHPFKLHLNCGPNGNTSTGLLVHSNIDFSLRQVQNIEQGRLQLISFNLNDNKFLNICNSYFPTNLEYATPNSTQFLAAQSLSTKIRDFFSSKSGDKILTGDFNETRHSFERASGKQGPYGCRILNTLIEEGELADASIDTPDFTFQGMTYGRRTEAKLDRFLLSPSTLEKVQEYKVHNDALGFFGSDHMVISVHLRIRCPKRTTKYKRKYPKLHPSFFPLNERPILWKSVNNEMKSFFRNIQKMHPETFQAQKNMNRLFETFVDIIHNKARMTRRAWKRKTIASPSLVKSLLKRRKALRKLKYSLSSFQKHQGVCPTESLAKLVEIGSAIFPSPEWCTSNFSMVSKELRIEITNLTQQIKTLLSRGKDLSYQTNEEFFSASRRAFYSKYVRNRGRDTGLLNQIIDPTTNNILVDGPPVKERVNIEAKKIFHYTPSPPPRPSWFEKLYDPETKSISSATWYKLTQPFVISEVLDTLRAVKNKAPGLDGLTKEILVFLCSPNVPPDNARSPQAECFTAKSLLFLLNKWYSTGVCPSLCAQGQILPIKKPGKDPMYYSNRRPLTMLSELGKIPMKILASRLQKILYKHPDLLALNQNGFLKEGGIDGPIRFLLDQIKVHQATNSPMYLIAYDQAKAYDSVQWWHLEHTFQRFSMPTTFQNFILTYLRTSQSCVLTAHGNTPFFDLRCSVRQGDPLSPLLYIMCLDGLHTILNDLSHEENVGVSWMASDHVFRTVSLGYADDTAIFCESANEMLLVHNLVNEYFAAHCLKLNYQKTEARYMCLSDNEVTLLTSLNWGTGEKKVCWKNDAIPFRYLGLQISCDMNPQHHLDYCESKRLYPYLSNMSKGRMSLRQTISATKEMVWAILDFSTRFFSVPLPFVEKWDRLFASVIVKKANLCKKNISTAGLFSVVGLLKYKYQYPVAVLSEHIMHINLPRSIWNVCSRSILFEFERLGIRDPLAYRRLKHTEPLSILQSLYERYRIEICRNMHYVGDIHTAQCLLNYDLVPLSIPSSPPDNLAPVIVKSEQTIFIDGGFRDPQMTWSVVYQDTNKDWKYFCGNLECEEGIGLGGPFGAETVAMCKGLELFAECESLTIYSDCERLLNLLNQRHLLTTRKYLRHPARPLLRYILNVLATRPNIQLLFVNRNSEMPDVVSTGNKKADLHAKLARYDPRGTFDFVCLEYPMLLLIEDDVVFGDYRKHLTEHMWEHQVTEWRAKPTNGICPRSAPHIVRKNLKLLAELIGPVETFKPWFIDTLCHNLPNGQMLSFHPSVKKCWLCQKNVTDNSAHYLKCSYISSQVQGLWKRIKPLMQSNRKNNLSQSLTNILQDHLRKCQEIMVKYLPQLPSILTNSLIHRYFTNLVVHDKIISIQNFISCVHTLSLYSDHNQYGFGVLSRKQRNWATKKFPYNTAIILRTKDIPRSCCHWSFYGFSSQPIANFDEQTWYENENIIQNELFLFCCKTPDNEFWSLERQLSTQCKNGSIFWVITLFKTPETYTSPSNTTVESTYFQCVDLWVWKFSTVANNLPKLSTQSYLNSRNIPPSTMWDALQPLQPLFQEELWIFTCPSDTLSLSLSRLLDEWRQIDTLSFLLGFFDTKVSSQLQFSCSKLKARNLLQKRSWRFLRMIYYHRRRRYEHLCKWRQNCD